MKIDVPEGANESELALKGRTVHLTNLRKVFWPGEGIAKLDLIRYYASISNVLLPHLQNRAMVMKRYPNGIDGKFFFMKRTPEHRPDWIETCSISHRSGNVIDFPMVQDAAALLWLINLGCIDLNPWYAACDDVNRPDYLHFDLDPVPPAGFPEVCQTALKIKEYFDERNVPTYPKTTGSRGIHVYLPIERGPLQKQVWTIAKKIAGILAKRSPDLITDVYRIADRPPGHVLVDYNQNAWGRTLASVYSVRPKPGAPVSMPVHWDEIAAELHLEDFHLKNACARIDAEGDLFKPLLAKRDRSPLDRLI